MRYAEIAENTPPEVKWVRPLGTEGYDVVWVDVGKFDKDWQKERDFYVGPNGSGNAISGRYPRFRQFLALGKPVEMPMVGYNEHFRTPGFTNGRHRFAVLRDMGVQKIPVVVPQEQTQIFKDLYEQERTDEIVKWELSEPNLHGIAGGGPVDQAYQHAAESGAPPTIIPAPNGQIEIHDNNFFLMIEGQPAVRLQDWGHARDKKMIGPIGALQVNPQFQRQGLGKMLYRALLDDGWTIMSGDNHTQHSAKLWQWLGTQPDIQLWVTPGNQRDLKIPVRVVNGELVSDKSEYPVYHGTGGDFGGSIKFIGKTSTRLFAKKNGLPETRKAV